MCGLCGIVSDQSIDPDIIRLMNNQMVHRGPDGEGYLVGGPLDKSENAEYVKSSLNIAFGHRRLSIVDLSELGHQPMSYRERYWIVFNGEIYNYLELREELIALGHVFISHTDTEVVLAAYDEWGTNCLSKFNGMWALAIFDTETQVLFMSRDRLGIKPLYYYQDGQRFIFASEIKAILKHPSVQAIPNLDYCRKYLESGAEEYLRKTAFENIYRFSSASFIELPLSNIFNPFKEIRFWDFEVNLSTEIFDAERAKQYALSYYELLKDSVRLRLRADVKTGTALSGGLDSSSIVYLVDEILEETSCSELQEVFSTVYNRPGTGYCDESKYINELVDGLAVKSHRVEPTEADFPMLHMDGHFFLETPPNGVECVGTELCGLVNSAGVVVTLDGQGADEQQAGYLGYFSNYLATMALFDAIRAYFRLRRIAGSSLYLKIGLILNISMKVLPHKLIFYIGKKLFKRDFRRFCRPLNSQLKEDTVNDLANLIHYSDRRSSRFSLESRMPFMDYRLVEYTASIPGAYKIHDGWTKYFARLAFEGRLPDSIVWREDKMGWPLPTELWFKKPAGPLYQWLVDTVNNSSFVNGLASNINLDRWPMSKKLRYLNLAVWHSLFFSDKEGPVPSV